MLIRGKAEKEDLIYAACSLDCEGSITLCSLLNKRGWHSSSIYVSIANTDKKLIDFLSNVFGGSVYTESPKKLSKKLIYRWKLVSNQAAGFLQLVRPYMKLKGAQAELAIEFMRIKNTIPHSDKDAYAIRMRALNKGEPPAETKRENAEYNLQSDSPTLVEMPVS